MNTTRQLLLAYGDTLGALRTANSKIEAIAQIVQ